MIPAEHEAFYAALTSRNRGLLQPEEQEVLRRTRFVIAGCGGYFLTEDKALARLVWGIVRRDWHRQGLGRFLLLFRLREITKVGGVQMVRLETSQHSAPFFESQGFKVVRVAKDEYAAALDRVEMTMKLTVCP